MGELTRRVITFYSFKGGAGCTFAVCAVAVHLARLGYRVLCVDFDLETPGLEYYFKRWLEDDGGPGMLEILTAWAQGTADEKICQEAVQTTTVPETEGRLAVLRSGSRGDDYTSRLRAINWKALFEDHDGGRRLEALRERWLKQFDIVLVDSRAGMSDTAEICTVHLPDILVTLFTLDEQSFRGGLDVAAALRRGVARLPLDRGPLRVVPVLARIDTAEYAEQQSRTEQMLIGAAQFVKDWDPCDETSPKVLAQLVIPYVPYWTYGERLAALQNECLRSVPVSQAHEALAALLAHGLMEGSLLVNNRESYIQRQGRI